jgi:protoporphyrinogen oxidase
MAKIIIIGAGPTGLSAAYHLEKLKFYDYILFEKEATVGGLCRSLYQDGFTFDYTGHLLHINDEYVHSFVDSLVGLHNFQQITRRSYVYSHKLYTPYPFQTNLYGLPIEVIAQCIEGYVNRNKNKLKKNSSFIDWVYKQFGQGFAKHFFIPYQKKIFSHDLRTISASWTGRFVPGTSLEKIIAGAIFDQTQEQIGYNAEFLYPKTGGIYYWVNAIAQHIKQPIVFNSTVTKIDLSKKKITLANGHTEPFSYIINTMPLDVLLENIHEAPTTTLKRACAHLKCNKVVNFNIGINKPEISNKHWIYYPEALYPFYRVGFPFLLSPAMAPTNYSSISGEIAYMHQSPEWVNTALKKSFSLVKRLFSIDTDDIVTQLIVPISHAYVIYDFWREKNITNLLGTLESHAIYCAGRYAEWKYSSMQEAILDGKNIVNKILIKPAYKIFDIEKQRTRSIQIPYQKEHAQ